MRDYWGSMDNRLCDDWGCVDNGLCNYLMRDWVDYLLRYLYILLLLPADLISNKTKFILFYKFSYIKYYIFYKEKKLEVLNFHFNTYKVII